VPFIDGNSLVRGDRMLATYAMVKALDLKRLDRVGMLPKYIAAAERAREAAAVKSRPVEARSRSSSRPQAEEIPAEKLVAEAAKRNGEPGALVGERLRRGALLDIDSLISLTVNTQGQESADGDKLQKANKMWFAVAGSFSAEDIIFEPRGIIIGLKDGRQLFGMDEKSVGGIQVWLADYRKAEAAKEAIQKLLPPGFAAQAWDKALGGELIKYINFENDVMRIVLFFIALLAGVTVFVILWMMVLEKRKDIGILKAVGATGPSIVFTFVLNGFLIGLTGSLLAFCSAT